MGKTGSSLRILTMAVSFVVAGFTSTTFGAEQSLVPFVWDAREILEEAGVAVPSTEKVQAAVRRCRRRRLSQQLAVLMSAPRGEASSADCKDEVEGPRFLRSDASGEGDVNLADVLIALNFLFLRSEAPGCVNALDTTDDGRVNVSDVVALVSYLFRDASGLPEPAACGIDPTEDDLSCVEVPSC